MALSGKFKNLWREPLVHFLFMGLLLFVLFDLTKAPDETAANRIVVDADQVAQLITRFEGTWMRPPTESEIEGIIDSHVREEVYYREALAMGLDRDDQVVRQRMRLKLEFILEDLATESDPGDQVLLEYLEKNQDKFMLEAWASFRHVYLKPERPHLEADAEDILAALQAGSAPETSGDATLLSDSFNATTESRIARTFGHSFAKKVVSLPPGEWAGPIYSGLGAHLVLVTESEKEQLPALEDVRGEVEREYLAQRRRELKEISYQALLKGYEIIVEKETGDNPAGTAMAETGSDGAGL